MSQVHPETAGGGDVTDPVPDPGPSSKGCLYGASARAQLLLAISLGYGFPSSVSLESDCCQGFVRWGVAHAGEAQVGEVPTPTARWPLVSLKHCTQ